MGIEKEFKYTPLPEPILITEQDWPEGTLPLVHTRHMTFNHENYIRDCIEGVLLQKTTFPVQVLIHDDTSTDKTGEIVREYELMYPKLIKAYYQKENTFRKPDKHERRKAFMDWRIGKYEAPCEGDDYWTDPLKLQKQVDYMESNPECVLTHHTWNILDQSNNKISDKVNKGYRTLTLLFRNELSDFKSPKQVVNGDMVLKFYLSTKGKFKFLENVKPAIHRHHNGGIWSKTGDYFKLSNKLKTLEEIVHLYENTKHVNKARLNLASIVFSYHISKQELLDKYIKENSIDNLNSYLNINKIKRLFILQKIKNLLRKFLK